MKTQGWLSTVGHFFRDVLLVEAAIALLALFAWWLLGFQTAQGYGQGLMLVGALTATAGVFSLVGTAWMTANPNNVLPRRLQAELLKPRVEASPSGEAPILVMLVAGLIGALAGLWLLFLLQ